MADPLDLDASKAHVVHCDCVPQLAARVRELEAGLRLISHMNDLGNIHTTARGALGVAGRDGETR